MKRDLLARTALCALMAALSACGDSDGSATSAAVASTTATTSPASAGASAPAATAAPTASAGNTALVSKVKLSSASYSVNASAGTAVIAVERIGANGALAIKYSTSNGSGVNGVDYTAAAGNLSWSDGDSSVKKIYVPVGAKGSGKTFHVALAASSSNAALTSPSAATVMITAPAEAIPPAAEQAGFRTQTFGPALSMGENWLNDNFYGLRGTGGVNNSDGTVTVSGDGSGHISTAAQDVSKPHRWKGTAFGGGAYFEAVFSFANASAERLGRWPAFWASDIENMAADAVTSLTQWLGQPEGYGNWIETDFFEYDRSNLGEYGIQIHDWYGLHGHNQPKDVMGYTSGVHVPSGFKWSDTHKYGFLWVPATATSQGYVQAYLDDVPMGPAIYWNHYNPEAPPAPLVGTTAFSVLDARHLALIFDTGRQNPMTIHSVTVWQQSASGNLTQ